MKNYYKIIVFVIITAVITASFLIQIDVPVLKDKARIIFLHVPMAWLAVFAYLIAMIYSILYLKKKDYLYDVKAVASAELGFLFTILATVTGSLWAKFSWGSFWNWDPRETSIFILLLIYGAYFALRSSIDNPDTKARLSSVYSIIAFITVPFFIFIMPRLVATLHPDPIINNRGQVNMSPIMRIVFFSSLTGFTMLYFWLLNLKIRVGKLLLNKNNEQ